MNERELEKTITLLFRLHKIVILWVAGWGRGLQLRPVTILWDPTRQVGAGCRLTLILPCNLGGFRLSCQWQGSIHSRGFSKMCTKAAVSLKEVWSYVSKQGFTPKVSFFRGGLIQRSGWPWICGNFSPLAFQMLEL